jgi:hypothetical protein
VRLATKIAGDRSDGAGVHERGAVDLPEDFRVEAVDELADRRLDERLRCPGSPTRVYFSSDWKKSTSETGDEPQVLARPSP